jgi:hypothetical protein
VSVAAILIAFLIFYFCCTDSGRKRRETYGRRVSIHRHSVGQDGQPLHGRGRGWTGLGGLIDLARHVGKVEARLDRRSDARRDAEHGSGKGGGGGSSQPEPAPSPKGGTRARGWSGAASWRASHRDDGWARGRGESIGEKAKGMLGLFRTVGKQEQAGVTLNRGRKEITRQRIDSGIVSTAL